MSDDKGAFSESTVTLTITGTNNDPIATMDAEASQENQTLTIDVLANDSDVDQNDNPANFTLRHVAIVNDNGNELNNKDSVSIVNNQLRFEPGSDFDYLGDGSQETVTVFYVMSDDQGALSDSTVTLTITGTNDAPIADSNTGSNLPEGGIIAGDMGATFNASDVAGGNTGSTLTEGSITAGDVVATFSASDVDNTLSYSLTGGNDDGYFEINSETGQVTLTQTSVDAINSDEGVDLTSFTLTAVASDGSLSTPAMSADINITRNAMFDLTVFILGWR